MSPIGEFTYFDPLYGQVWLSSEIADLVHTPLVQRLRRIRLSNIDSLSMPGIANISRFEHALGTAYLATVTGFSRSINRSDRIVLEAAALVHDTAITPFGHLIEEAFSYLDQPFNHEMKWALLLAGEDGSDVGGFKLQVYLGHGSGLKPWALRVFKNSADEQLQLLVDTISGRGRFGRCLAADLDLDNLDNLTRIAFHMGLGVDKELPRKIALEMVDVNELGSPIFSHRAVKLISEWLVLREAVYSRLMPAESDFSGKLMLLYATKCAFETGVLDLQDWKLTDDELIAKLLSAPDKRISGTARDWLLGRLWNLGPLLWMSGDPPSFSQVAKVSALLSETLERPCLAYRITDKRTRQLRIRLDSSQEQSLGEEPHCWLLGFGSPSSFSSSEIKTANSLVTEFFHSSPTLFGAAGM